MTDHPKSRDPIDPTFIDMIVAAKKRGELEVTTTGMGKGANLRFKFRDTVITLLLAEANWLTVQKALRELDN